MITPTQLSSATFEEMFMFELRPDPVDVVGCYGDQVGNLHMDLY